MLNAVDESRKVLETYIPSALTSMIIAYYEQNRDFLTPEVVPPLLQSVLNAIPTFFQQKLDVPHKAFLALDELSNQTGRKAGIIDDIVIFYNQFQAPITTLGRIDLFAVMNSYNSDSHGASSLEDQLYLTQSMMDAFRRSVGSIPAFI